MSQDAFWKTVLFNMFWMVSGWSFPLKKKKKKLPQGGHSLGTAQPGPGHTGSWSWAPSNKTQASDPT